MPPVPARMVRLALACGIALTLAACGSGAVDDPGADGGATANNAGGGATQQNPGNGGATDYDRPWEPPKGDESVQAFEGHAIGLLHQGACDDAQQYIDSTEGLGFPAWQQFNNQRDLLLFQAGIELCRNNRDNRNDATGWYRRAAALGWAGTIESNNKPYVNICALYQAVASTIENRPRNSFVCQRGDIDPQWKSNNDEPPRYDDPRTPEDESATTAQPSADAASPTETQ